MERLWERSREERKETNSEAKYRNLEGRHEKSGRRERGNRESESGNGHRESSCKAEPGGEGKEEQRLSSQNPKLKRTKECENSGGQKADWIAATGRVKVRPRESRKRKQKASVSQKKQLQRLKLAEDERKLQTKRFVKQCVWRSQD